MLTTATTVVGAIVPIMLKEGLKEENIEKVAEFLVASGKKLGSKAAQYLEERKRRMEASGENAEDGGIPAEVQEEMQASFMECLERQAKDIYMGGVAFFCERPMDEETQKALEEILTNINDETETMEWEDEADEACQRVVDDFMWRNYGRSLNKWEEDYHIEKDLLYLNFAFDDEEEYYRLCDDGALRLLADALNHLLRDRYLAKFTTY